jgi:O-antigen/teichoic acid export membrane protein
LDEQHGASLALSFFSPLGGLAGGAVGFALGANVASFFAGSAIGLVVTSFLLAGLRLGFYGFAAKRADMTGILSRILPFIFIAALGWLGGYGNTYLVESFFTASDVAKFTFAYTLSSVLQLVATSLNQVWSPRFYRMAHTQPPQEVEPANRRFFAFQGAAIGLAGGCILVLLPGAIDHVGGNLVAYRRINLELLILFAAYAVSIPAWQSQNYFYAFNKGKDLMHVTLVGSVAGLILWVLAALTLGTIGAYVGFMMQMLTRSVTAIIRARREWGIRVAWEGPALAMLLLIAGAAASAAIYR